MFILSFLVRIAKDSISQRTCSHSGGTRDSGTSHTQLLLLDLIDCHDPFEWAKEIFS